VPQTTSQALFKMTAVCLNTSFESCLPLANGVVHDALLELMPCLNHAAAVSTQPRHVADWILYTRSIRLHHAPDVVVHRVQVMPHVRTGQLLGLVESVFSSNNLNSQEGWLVGWCLTALSAQKGYIVLCEK